MAPTRECFTAGRKKMFLCFPSHLPPPKNKDPPRNELVVGRFGPFACGSLPPPPPGNELVIGKFGPFAFGSLPLPPEMLYYHGFLFHNMM